VPVLAQSGRAQAVDEGPASRPRGRIGGARECPEDFSGVRAGAAPLA
jgi:hypothetical protein